MATILDVDVASARNQCSDFSAELGRNPIIIDAAGHECTLLDVPETFQKRRFSLTPIKQRLAKRIIVFGRVFSDRLQAGLQQSLCLWPVKEFVSECPERDEISHSLAKAELFGQLDAKPDVQLDESIDLMMAAAPLLKAFALAACLLSSLAYAEAPAFCPPGGARRATAQMSLRATMKTPPKLRAKKRSRKDR